MPRAISWSYFLIIGLLTLIPAILYQQSTTATTAGHILKTTLNHLTLALENPSPNSHQPLTTIANMKTPKPRTPIYFLSHGVWASFMCLFDPKTNPLVDIPIVQVSLFDYFEAEMHFNLGKAIASVREEGVLIIVSGMAVHNLRDLERSGALDYSLSFDEALRKAVEQDDASSREEAMTQLMSRKDFKKAHPSADHLMPIYVGAGAAGEDKGVRLFTLAEGSFSWAQFRFGEVDDSVSLAVSRTYSGL